MFKKKVGQLYVDNHLANFIAACVLYAFAGLMIWGLFVSLFSS